VPGTEALPSPTPGEVNTSETEANALHVTPVMDKIAETSSKAGVLFFSNKYNYIYYAFQFYR
jgi:malate/lactate dehydrogenase